MSTATARLNNQDSTSLRQFRTAVKASLEQLSGLEKRARPPSSPRLALRLALPSSSLFGVSLYEPLLRLPLPRVLPVVLLAATTLSAPKAATCLTTLQFRVLSLQANLTHLLRRGRIYIKLLSKECFVLLVITTLTFITPPVISSKPGSLSATL